MKIDKNSRKCWKKNLTNDKISNNTCIEFFIDWIYKKTIDI